MPRSEHMSCGGCVRTVHPCTSGSTHRVLGAQSCPPSTAGHGACPSRALEGPVTAYQAVMGGWGQACPYRGSDRSVFAQVGTVCRKIGTLCRDVSRSLRYAHRCRPTGRHTGSLTEAAQSPPSANAPSRGLAVKSRPRREPALQAGSLTGRGFVIEDHAPLCAARRAAPCAYGCEPYACVSMA